MNPDFSQIRETMVEQQVRPWEVLDPRVLETINTVPREAFVAESHRALAYMDTELPLGNGDFMMKPVVEGRVLQALVPRAGESVLEIGTGSGYLTACLAHLAGTVVSLEIDPVLAQAATNRLAAQGVANATVHAADAFGWNPGRTFDVVCVTGAVAAVPDAFRQWLAPNGRMFIVRGESPAMEAMRIESDGHAQSLFETDLQYLVGAEPAPAFTL